MAALASAVPACYPTGQATEEPRCPSPCHPSAPTTSAACCAPTASRPRASGYFEEKSISADALKAVEDAAIREVIALQEAIGLKAVTDGEFRRSWWHYDFIGALTGFELEEREEGVQFAGVKLRPIFPTITGELDFPADHPMLEHFRFVAANTSVAPKISIPGPSCCHFRTLTADIHPAEYHDPDVLFADIAATYRKAVAAFYAAGCRYLQMDDIFFAYLCDPKHRAARAAEGQDPDWLIDRYAWMMHEAIKDRPADMLIAHAHVPRQLQVDLRRRGRLRPRRRRGLQQDRRRRLLHGVRHRARRRPRAAAPAGEGQEAGAAGLHHHQDRHRSNRSTT